MLQGADTLYVPHYGWYPDDLYHGRTRQPAGRCRIYLSAHFTPDELIDRKIRETACDSFSAS